MQVTEGRPHPNGGEREQPSRLRAFVLAVLANSMKLTKSERKILVGELQEGFVRTLAGPESRQEESRGSEPW